MGKNAKLALMIGGVIVAILVLVPLVAGLIRGWQGYGYGYGMMGPWMMGGLGGFWFMPILMVLFWVLIIWGIIALVRGGSPSGNSGAYSQPESPEEVLKRRYARGEINKAEFEQKKRDLV